MNTLRTRIARLTAASVLVLGLGALGAGPALATGSTWSGSATPDSVNLKSVNYTADDGASPDGLGRPGGVQSVEDGAATGGGQSTDGQIGSI